MTRATAASGTNMENAKRWASAKAAGAADPVSDISVSISATVRVVPSVLAAVPKELNMAERMP